MQAKAWAALSLLALTGCDSGGACAFNSECAAGSYCHDGECTFDCESDAECETSLGVAARCTTFGMCVAGDAGMTADAGIDAGGGEDAGSSDAGIADAGTEAGPPDGGPPDAGCAAGATLECATECGSTGTATCSGASFGECAPPDEICNAADDDCDSVTDDGFRVDYRTISYASDFDPALGCTAAGSIQCNTAVHRYCAARGCTTSGFGPVEIAGDAARVGCVIGDVRVETFAVLATHHAGCSASAPVSPACSAAIHRYCSAAGLTTGFGPVQVGPGDAVTFTCVSDATTGTATFAELSAIQSACDGSSMIQGISCSSAINRHCQSLGHASGFGPLEWSGSVVAIACVDP